jgi:hypothetical protein
VNQVRPQVRDERGIAVLGVVFLVLLIGGLALGLLQEGIAARTALAHHETSLKALEVAETGLVRAEQEIRSQVDFGKDGIGAVTGKIDQGSYAVTAKADPVSVDRFVLTASGTRNLSTRRIEVGVRRRRDRRFVEALYSRDGLTFNGVTDTDAYDSSLGSYASQAVNGDAGGTYALYGGHVGSNSAITLTGSSVFVRGNAIPGPLETVRRAGDPTVLGDMAPREFPIELAPTPAAEFVAAMNTNSNGTIVTGGGAGGRIRYHAGSMSLTVTGGATATLNAGTYFFRDLTVTGSSTLQTSGSVKIFVTGSFDTGGGTLVNLGRPQDLQVFAHPYALPAGHFPSSTLVRVRGGSGTAMALYGPEADFVLQGGGDFYGAAVARSVVVGGDARFHYDRSLGTLGAEGVATMERIFWRDLSVPRR